MEDLHEAGTAMVLQEQAFDATTPADRAVLAMAGRPAGPAAPEGQEGNQRPRIPAALTPPCCAASTPAWAS